ncbi:MAG: GntR family transcriptional regulator, carbon starvation induced regulator [Solirubrobacteraceae bacterium]|jgi:DNA-binding GntR family transcriptional regulator|nr:GntR family transcriptional regulator, carbon starvation induced regulator [Solirubrobacteraceae bacterium]
MDEPVTRVDWAIARLSDGILTGALAPGQRLKAPELAERWSLSPTPVREALQRLAAIGLVETIANRGARVAPVVEQEMREVYSLRLLLEPLALRSSLERRDDAWRAGVGRAFDALRAELEPGRPDLLAFERTHGAFHDALLAGCDSTWLMRIIHMLGTHSVRYRLLSLGPRGGPAEVLAEHWGLYDACLGDDVDDAVRRLFEHIRRTVEAVTDASHADEVVELMGTAGRHIHLEPRSGS